jgi:hypothetical protein
MARRAKDDDSKPVVGLLLINGLAGVNTVRQLQFAFG